MELGLPDHSKIWTLDDYITAGSVLGDLKVNQPLSLPKKGSRKSGEYFKRIVHTDNLSFLMDESLPLKNRAYKIQEYIDAVGSLITVYTDMDTVQQFYNSELIDLYIFAITISQNMLDLGQQINESVDEEDLGMQYAFNSIRKLYVRMILFTLDNQKKSNFFKKEDLERLTEFISGSIQLNKEWLVPAVNKDIKLRIESIIEDTSSEKIKTEYTELIEIL
jgi:hypothetical protein